MTEPVDPYELLRDLNPVAPDDVAEAASTAEATRALEEIIAGTRQLPAKRRLARIRIPRIRRRFYLLALVPAVGAIAAAAWALTHGATKQFTVGCYATADLQAHTVIVPAGADGALETCRSVWRRGDFGVRAIPPLQACVLPSGAIGVFPSPNQHACTQLHLTALTPTKAPPPNRKVGSPIELKNDLVHTFLASRCMNEQQAVDTVNAEIRRLGLSEWRVQVNGRFTSSRPCASLAFDQDIRHVLIIPLPRRP
jgi:hypothetical protein